MKLQATTMALVALLGTAQADPCGDPPKKPTRRVVKKRPPPPPKPVATPETKPCNCKGEKGERGDTGPQGPKGDAGKSVLLVKEVRARPAIAVYAGLTGFTSNPHLDWAWGPALGLSSQVNEKYDLNLGIGLAAGASDGRESGYILSLTGVRNVRRDLGIFAGVSRVKIDGSKDNGNVDGDYLGLTAGISLRGERLRLDLGPTLSGLRDDSEDGTQFAIGVQASLFVRLGQ